MARITAADHGTWLDGAHGWTNGYRAVERAISFGWTVPEEYAEGWAAFQKRHGDSDLWEDANGDDGGFVDAATDYLQTLTPEGYVFRWDAGELALVPAWMDCADGGGGCEIKGFDEEGVIPCLDHKPDHLITVTPGKDGEVTVILSIAPDPDGPGDREIGRVNVMVTGPRLPEPVDFWFPELIQSRLIREAAERLIKRTRCEGHYDDDHTLTSGAGIGEPTFCDGSCQS